MQGLRSGCLGLGMGTFSRQIQWDVTRSVTIASIFYFLYQAGKTCLFPFITLYYRRLGLSATQVGLICGSKSLMWYFAAPLWIMLARRAQKTKIVLGTAILIAIASNLSITLVPPVNRVEFARACKTGLVSVPHDFIKNLTAVPTDGSVNTSNFDVTVSRTHFFGSTVSTSISTSSMDLISFSTAMDYVTTAASRTTTTMTPYQMAEFLLPRILYGNATVQTNIADLVSQFEETKNWPQWKKHVLVVKLRHLIQQASSMEQSDINEEQSEMNGSVSLPDNRQTAETQNQKARSLSKTIQRLTDYLLPIYDEQKALHPQLTAESFVESSSITSSLSPTSKHLLSRALENALTDSAAARRKKRREDIDGKSLSDEGMHTQTNSSDMNNLLNVIEETERNESNKMGNSIDLLMNKVLPNITDNASTFLMILLIIVVGEIFAAPIDMLSDNSFYELLDELDSLDRYGKHRVAALFGAMFFGITVSAMVYWSPCLLHGSIARFHIHFYAFAALIGLAFLITPFYPSYTPRSNAQPRGSSTTVCPTCTRLVCSNCRHRLLLVTVFVVGVLQAAVQDFILWEIQDMPGSSELVYGSYVSANALSAVLSALFGRHIMSVLKPIVMGPVSLYCIALQLLLYSYITNPWFIVPLQIFNIFGQSFIWTVVSYQTNMTMSASWQSEESGLVRRVNEIHVFARSSQKRALHMAYVCTHQGIAFAVGSVLSGVVYDAAGGTLAPVLRVGSLVTGLWGCIYLAYQCCCNPRRLHRKYSKLLADSDDEDEIYDDKHKKPSFGLGFSKNKNSGYVKNGELRSGIPKKKRRSRKMDDFTSSSSDDDHDQHDWLAAAMRKDSRML